jgi:ATP-binding cassette subfamily B multidrug efflux pump
MLWKLLVRYLRPHWKLLVAVGIFQLAQSIASLYLPALNADIIDEGVATGDTGYILRTGGMMLLITLRHHRRLLRGEGGDGARP